MSSRGIAQRALARLYDRLGSRVLFVLLASHCLLALVTMALSAAVAGRYFRLSASQILSGARIWSPIAIAFCAVALGRSRDHLRAILAWSGDGRTAARAPETWYAIVRYPRVLTRAAAYVGIGIPPGLAYFVIHFHEPWYAAAPIAAGGFVALGGLCALLVFETELFMRPMLEDVAAYLPADFEPPAEGIRLRTRALAPLPIVTLFASLTVGGYANLSADGPTRLALASGIGLATVSVATVIFMIINRSVLAPIDDLIAGTARVRAGDLTTPVPIVTSDELGALAHSFNQMLDALRRRTDELRASRERLAAAVVEERRDAEHDLRDGPDRHLEALARKLADTQQLIDRDPAAAAAMHEELRSDADRALAELRELAHGIHSPVLDIEGLPAALGEVARRTSPPADVRCGRVGRYPADLEAAVYHTCVKALQGTDGRTAPRIGIGERAGGLVFEVVGGGGIDASGDREGPPMQAMIDRIGAVGGELAVVSQADGETRLTGTVPLGTAQATSSPGGANADRGPLERALARMYDRIGARVLLVCVASSVLLAAITSAVTLFVGVRYLSLSVSQTLSFFALWLSILLALTLSAILVVGRPVRSALAWSRGNRTTADAIAAWEALVTIPQMVLLATIVPALGMIAAAFALTDQFHKPWWTGPVGLIGGFSALGGLWTLIVSSTELVVRPMLEEIAARLPPGFEPRVRGISLRTRALAPLPVITLFAAAVVGSLANMSRDATLRYTFALAVALATVTIAMVIFLVLTRTVLAPVDDLIAATRRVREGDLTTPVPVLSADELGALARSFNEMLADLSSRTEQLRRSRARIVAAADAERRRVERDLHDGAQQQLVLLALKLAMAQRLIEPDPDAARAVHAELRTDLEHALRELRDLANGLYPALLESDGLRGALTDAAAASPIPTTIDCDGAGRYRPEVEAAVYFCCLEALQNAAKHAGEGAGATIRLSHRDAALRFEVADSGRGFETNGTPTSVGLQNMTDRIGALGGELRVESVPGRGTTITGLIPFAEVP